MFNQGQANWKFAKSKADANQKVHHDQIVRTSKAHEQVFWHIFIAAPATISLSVTFVGYYTSQSQLLDFEEIGFAWGLLIAAMVLSVLRNLVHASYNQYQTYFNQVSTKLDEVEARKEVRELTEHEKNLLGRLGSEERSAYRIRELLNYIHPILGDITLFTFSFGVIVLVHFIYKGLTH